MKEHDLSNSQMFYWKEYVRYPTATFRNMSLIWEMKGEVNRTAIIKSLHDVVNNYYEGMRSQFKCNKGKVSQVIINNPHIHIETLDLTNNKKSLKYNIMKSQSFIEKITNTYYNLTDDLPFRYGMVIFNKRYYILVFSLHHIHTDAISAAFVTKTISKLYMHYQNSDHERPKVPIFSYCDYVDYEKDQITKSMKKNALQYWSDLLSGLDSFKIDFKDSNKLNKNDWERSSLLYSFNKDESRQLSKLAKHCRTTVFLLISSFFSLALSKFCTNRKMLISYPVSRRNRVFKNILGCFENKTVQVIDLDSSKTLQDLIEGITQQRSQSKIHQHVDLPQITEYLYEMNSNITEGNLESNVAIVETDLGVVNLEIDGIQSKYMPARNHQLFYDLSFTYQKHGDVIKFCTLYKSSLFSNDQINNFKDVFLSISRSAIADFSLLKRKLIEMGSLANL